MVAASSHDAPDRDHQPGGPAEIGDLLGGLMGRRKLAGQAGTIAKIREVWPEVAGEETASHTRLRSLRSGRLVVDVDSAARCHQLACFQRERILTELQRRLTRVPLSELHFRVGAFD